MNTNSLHCCTITVFFQTYAWDAGSDAGTTYTSLESDLDPPIPITRFIPATAPEGGELRGPDGQSVPVVAEWECFLVVGDQDIVLPDCDWFANPCCNETDKLNCGVKLPNGAPPQLSDEYREVLEGTGEPVPKPSAAMQHCSFTALVAGLFLSLQWMLA